MKISILKAAHTFTKWYKINIIMAMWHKTKKNNNKAANNGDLAKGNYDWW